MGTLQARGAAHEARGTSRLRHLGFGGQGHEAREGSGFRLQVCRGVVRRAEAGWTLIELLVVIALITILAGMGVANYRNSVTAAKEATLKTDLFRMRDAIDQYYADKGKYPASLQTLVGEGYMRKIPEDPITRSADTWQTVPAEPDPANPSAEPGVYDVKSGAEGTALDGTAYTEW